MKILGKAYLLGVGTALLALVPSAKAGLSQLNVSYYKNFTAQLYAQGSYHYVYATALSADLVGGDPLPVPHTDPFVTFCLDINTVLGNGWWQSGGFADTPLINDTTPADRVESGLYRAASLYNHYAGGIMNPGGSFAAQTGDATDGLYTARETGAALQLAIWEVLYEKTSVYSLSFNADGNAGNNNLEFYVTSTPADIFNLANTMLASQWNTEDRNIGTTFWNAVNQNGTYRSSQDLIGPMAPVPEPTTIVAGALLLLPFLVSTMRRKVQ